MALYSNGSPTPASTATPRKVTGQYLAKARLTRKQRARLAAELSNGTAQAFPLTVKQAAAIARVPLLDVTKARRNGKPANGRNGHVHVETLAEHIARSSPAERLDATRIVGCDVIWDSMLSPIVSEERAAANGNVS